jgi:hypothetical protein
LRWRNMLLSHSLSTWLEVVRTSHVEHAECKRLQVAAVRIVYQWQQKLMALAFATWHDHVAEAKQLKLVAGKVVRRWSCMTMSVTFFTWRENVLGKRKLQLAAAKIKARWRLMHLACPWLAWCDRTKHNKLLQRAEQTLRRWSKTDKAPALGPWKETYLAVRHAKLSSIKIFQRRKVVIVAAAFERWCEKVKRLKKLVATAHKVTARWINVGLFCHFEHWLFLVDDSKWAEQVQRDQPKKLLPPKSPRGGVSGLAILFGTSAYTHSDSEAENPKRAEQVQRDQSNDSQTNCEPLEKEDCKLAKQVKCDQSNDFRLSLPVPSTFGARPPPKSPRGGFSEGLSILFGTRGPSPCTHSAPSTPRDLSQS